MAERRKQTLRPHVGAVGLSMQTHFSATSFQQISPCLRPALTPPPALSPPPRLPPHTHTPTALFHRTAGYSESGSIRNRRSFLGYVGQRPAQNSPRDQAPLIHGKFITGTLSEPSKPVKLHSLCEGARPFNVSVQNIKSNRAKVRQMSK